MAKEHSSDLKGSCKWCNTPLCLCKLLDDFFEENRDLMDDLQEKPVKSCMACYFAPCRCKSGLTKKKR